MTLRTYNKPGTSDERLQEWDQVIKPRAGFFEINLKEIWAYRDLLSLLVHRDVVATYKQTVLGPIWFFLQPILTSLIYVIIFGRIAGIPTDGIPMVLFYLAGTILWNYFAECLNKTAIVFKENANIFGKVYFPRLIMPLSIIVSNLVKLGIQLILFLLFWAYYLFIKNSVHPTLHILLTPYLVFLMGALSLGMGMTISALTTKYRDLVFLLAFGVQLAMYVTPVIYPMSSIHSKYRVLLQINPMTAIIETFRLGFLGKGSFSLGALAYSTVMTLFILFIGILVFNKVEKSFMDTV